MVLMNNFLLSHPQDQYQIELNNLDSREEIDLGGITYFQINPLLAGVSIEEIQIQVYDEDNYIYEEILELIIGETTVF